MIGTDGVLRGLGWNDHVAEAIRAGGWEGQVVGRVVRIDRGRPRVATTSGELRPVIGRHEVAVGDWVVVDATPRSERVVGIAERFSAIRRQAAGEDGTGQLLVANVDHVFLVVSLETSPNLRRLERALALVWSSGAVPVVVLTKADRCPDEAGAIAAVRSVAVDVELVVTSKPTGRGFEELRRWCRPRPDGSVPTVALLGASGAGKSTLVNVLSGRLVMDTGAVREGDAKGRHTTTHRRLVQLPEGGLLIDTPGLRSIGLWDAAEGLERTFSDVHELAAGCRFRDCKHSGEPGCAVVAAVDDGRLARERLDAWLSLHAEMVELEERRERARRRRPG